MRHQVARLNKQRRNPRTFWRIANFLLFRSLSFALICYNHTYKGWHREIPFSLVKRSLMGYLKLDLSKYVYFLLPIPKDDIVPLGPQIPLSVPAGKGRIFLHGLNCILIIYLQPFISPSQHGFLPVA